LSRSERLALIDWQTRELPIKTQAELLGLNRTHLYYKPRGPSEEELALKREIDEIYTEYPFYGSRRITAVLRARGWHVNRKAIQRHMREMGLEAIYPKANLSRDHQAHRVYPYLLRGLRIHSPNQVWGTDITYIRMRTGWMYLVVVLDWYSRYVVSWSLSDSLEVDFVLEAVEQAFAKARPKIINSDQGSQYTSPAYIQRVESAGVRISMDGRGRALDNVFTERFWRSLKYEEVYLNDYVTPRQTRQSISDYLEYYNERRPHQALNYQTPATVYAGTGVELSAIISE
jgi:putative transposase